MIKRVGPIGVSTPQEQPICAGLNYTKKERCIMLSNLGAMIGIEILKASRSRMPLFTALGFLLMPLMDAFFMSSSKTPILRGGQA